MEHRGPAPSSADRPAHGAAAQCPGRKPVPQQKRPLSRARHHSRWIIEAAEGVSLGPQRTLVLRRPVVTEKMAGGEPLDTQTIHRTTFSKKVCPRGRISRYK